MCAAVGSHCERRAPMATSLSGCNDKLNTFERVTDMKCVHYKLNKGTNLTPVILMLMINKIPSLVNCPYHHLSYNSNIRKLDIYSYFYGESEANELFRRVYPKICIEIHILIRL